MSGSKVVGTSELWSMDLDVGFHANDTACPSTWSATLDYSGSNHADVCVSATHVASSNSGPGTRHESKLLSDFTSTINTAQLERADTKICTTGVAARFKNKSLFGKKGAFCLEQKKGQPAIAPGVDKSFSQKWHTWASSTRKE